MENTRQKIAEIITHTHKTPLEQADEILLLFSVVGQSEQLCPKCGSDNLETADNENDNLCNYCGWIWA